MALWFLLGIAALFAITGYLFIRQPSFGRTPQGVRMERIKRSPNYRNGAFCNQLPTPMLTSDKGRLSTMLGFLFRNDPKLKPSTPLPAVRTNLHKLPREKNAVVWFGHSSYLIQASGKRFLVDPVFCTAAPVGFFNKPFEGTNIYHPEDMPDIDFLIITHDHWDHLDYQTVMRLKERIGHIICPLGVGEHFERWGFGKEILTELDWHENFALDNGFTIHCLPARHFSGRGLVPNQTLWASYILDTSSAKIFIAGDGGYGPHFARIGKQFPDIDLAVMENGQYNDDWRYIHMMPEHMATAAHELHAKSILTVHHSKYALARHPWDEPLRNEQRMIYTDSLPVIVPQIGEVIPLCGKE